jgi:hypothetical protein
MYVNSLSALRWDNPEGSSLHLFLEGSSNFLNSPIRTKSAVTNCALPVF